MKEVTSSENALYKSLRRLARSSRSRRDQRKIMLDGVHLVSVYLSKFGAQSVQLVVKKSAATHSEIRRLIERAEADALILTDRLFDGLSPVATPVGILAFAPLPVICHPASEGPTVEVLLEGIQDPGNLGAILRSAAAVGVSQAHLSISCADPWSPKSLRGGMGAQLMLPVLQHPILAAAARDLRARVIACMPDARTSLFDANLDGPIAFLFGGEGSGISRELLDIAQQQVRIPMRQGVESLNVAAAAAVCLFERVRREGGRRS